MERGFTVAVKPGKQIICEAFYEGAGAGPSLDEKVWRVIGPFAARRKINDSISPTE